ncbi:hypothetical protein B0T18DRAFT_399934 [Schizothecium vesticola]|uniref:Translation initiation factor 3 N-terminal domain-containing protein n=1 Tax=Schizothecium vesticola TaxID=314040 RepID=A0AA40FBK9_9PEZI|nr:hypothetical protein B0T18DRAFT_399934 [Schizothecium vesticola]
MSTPRCLFNSVVALRRVFLSNALPSEATSSLRRPTLPLLSPQPRRTLIYTKKKPWATADEEDDGRPKTDLAIRSPMIYLRDDETGKLGEPVVTREVLRSLDLKTQLLMMVAESVDMPGGKWPVCRVVDRRATELKERAKARELRQQSVMEKELELNWTIAAHDLALKMRQLRAFLDKGFRVTVTLWKKKKKGGGRDPSAEEAKKLLADVDEIIAGVPGVKEVKEREGTVGNTIKIVLQGQKVKAAKQDKEKATAREPAAEAEEAKVAEAQ